MSIHVLFPLMSKVSCASWENSLDLLKGGADCCASTLVRGADQVAIGVGLVCLRQGLTVFWLAAINSETRQPLPPCVWG